MNWVIKEMLGVKGEGSPKGGGLVGEEIAVGLVIRETKMGKDSWRGRGLQNGGER